MTLTADKITADTLVHFREEYTDENGNWTDGFAAMRGLSECIPAAGHDFGYGAEPPARVRYTITGDDPDAIEDFVRARCKFPADIDRDGDDVIVTMDTTA